MEVLSSWGGWLSLLVPALLAALGYLGKELLQGIALVRGTRRHRRARLSRLHSLLEAGRTAFEIQNGNRNRLYEMIEKRDPGFENIGGFERRFVAAYDSMTPDEKELHLLVRGITEHTIKPLNNELLDWLKGDNYFRARTPGLDLLGQLSVSLDRLHAHLTLWQAKYASWFVGNPKHALVYLADEEKHGLGFPREIQGIVEAMLDLPLRQDRRVLLKKGDIVFTRGVSLLSWAIRFFSRGPGESRTKVNHVGIVVEGGPLEEANIVEALSRVKRPRLMDRYGPSSSSAVAVFRTMDLEPEQIDAVVRKAESYVNKRYGYGEILAHLLDWLLLGVNLFRRLTSDDAYPICSWVVAFAFDEVRPNYFGGSAGTASPDDLWDAVERRPQDFQRVRPLATIRQRW